jgi:hypothetical protein
VERAKYLFQNKPSLPTGIALARYDIVYYLLDHGRLTHICPEVVTNMSGRLTSIYSEAISDLHSK